jgi:hypothetical protein
LRNRLPIDQEAQMSKLRDFFRNLPAPGPGGNPRAAVEPPPPNRGAEAPAAEQQQNNKHPGPR